jgi:hypothetical protein
MAIRLHVRSLSRRGGQVMIGSTEDFRRESWGVHPVLDVPELFPPAVMFSLLDSDPRSKYRDILQRMSEKQDQQALEPSPPLTPHLMRQGLLSVAWDAVFHEVPGDKIALLYRKEGRQASSEAEGGGPTYSVMIRSTESKGTKWLVSRAAQFEGKAVCWCTSVNVEKGDNTDVSLTLQNMIALEMIDPGIFRGVGAT